MQSLVYAQYRMVVVNGELESELEEPKIGLPSAKAERVVGCVIQDHARLLTPLEGGQNESDGASLAAASDEE